MYVSQHITEQTLKKTMCLSLFFCLMYNRDGESNSSVTGHAHTLDLTSTSVEFISISRDFVYRAYIEWRNSQEIRAVDTYEK